METERNNLVAIIRPEEEKDSSDAYTDVSLDDTPHIFIEVGVHKINALIDTGAQLSIVASRLLKELEGEGLTFKKLPIKATGVKGAFGDSMKTVRAIVQIPFRIANKDVTHKFLVVKELIDDLVIGIDFLKEQDAIINVKDCGVVLKDTPILEAKPMRVYKKRKLEKQKDDKSDKISQPTDLVLQQIQEGIEKCNEIFKKAIGHINGFIHKILMRDKKLYKKPIIYPIPNAYKQVLKEMSSLQDIADYGPKQNITESRDKRKMMQQMIQQYNKMMVQIACYKKIWQMYKAEVENLFAKIRDLQEKLEDKLRKTYGRAVIREIEEKETVINVNKKVEVANKKKAKMNDKKKDKHPVTSRKIIEKKIKIVKKRDPKLNMKVIVRLEKLIDEQIARKLGNNKPKRARKQTKFFGEMSEEANDVVMDDRPKFVDGNLISKIKRTNAYYHLKNSKRERHSQKDKR